VRRVRTDVAPLFRLAVRGVRTGDLLRSYKSNDLDRFAKGASGRSEITQLSLFRLVVRRVRTDVAPLFWLAVRRVRTADLLRSCGNG